MWTEPTLPEPTSTTPGERFVFVDLAMRVAAVFTIAGSTTLHWTDCGPRWLVAIGSVIGVVLLVGINFYAWLDLIFPLWVFVLSVHIVVAGFKRVTIAAPPMAPSD
jgi:hypothetical protein